MTDKSNTWPIRPGRWPWQFSTRDIGLTIKQKVTIHTNNGKVLNAVYLGRSKLSDRPMERFYVSDFDSLAINMPVIVMAGKKRIGTFQLATIRPDEPSIILIAEENMPCCT